jgi:hypothetical protein
VLLLSSASFQIQGTYNTSKAIYAEFPAIR